MLSTELKIALSYIKNTRGNSYTSLVSNISIIGLIISIISLITVLSVMNGLQQELKTRILSAISHAYITNYDGKIANYKALITKLENNKQIQAISPYIEQYALLNNNKNSIGAIIRGIDNKLEPKTSKLLKHIKYGTNSINNNKPQVIIGLGLATELAISIGDKIIILTPNINNSITAIIPKFKPFEVVGIFDIGIKEYNNSLLLMSINMAQKLYNMDGYISGLRLKFYDVFSAKQITSELYKQLGDKYYAISWQDEKSNLLTALTLEKNMIAIILFFIIAISSFNLVSMMVMAVVDKKTDIAILRTIGMTPFSIMKIFFYQSLISGIIGIIIGVILGVLLSFNIESVVLFLEQLFNFQLFPKDIFYINNLPSEVQVFDVLLVTIVAFVLTILSAIYPAYKASKTKITEAIKYD